MAHEAPTHFIGIIEKVASRCQVAYALGCTFHRINPPTPIEWFKPSKDGCLKI